MSDHAAPHKFTVGLFGIGLDAYWPQFEGLQQRLQGYLQRVAQRLAKPGVRVIDLGLVDSPEKAEAAGHAFRQHDVDLIFLYVTTYALSSTVVPAVRRAKVPVILLNLSPAAAIDYASFNRMDDRTKMTGEWLAHCQACPVPEIANVFRRCHIPFFQVTGILDDDPRAWNEIYEWLDAGRVAHTMEHNRLGVMGHYYGGMLDIYSDLTQQCAYFGGHMEILEVDELAALRHDVQAATIAQKVEEFRNCFDVQADCPPQELERAARTSVALDRWVQQHRLGSLAYYYQGAANTENEDTISSIILGASMLTARGIPVAGEYEIKNAQAMKIMDSFGVGGSFTEYYATDYTDDVVLMGHDGPGHLGIAQGRIKVRPLRSITARWAAAFPWKCRSNMARSRCFRSCRPRDKLIASHRGSGSVPGPILEIGNTNSRYRFPIGARRFIEAWNAQGPAHHCAIGVGHFTSKLKKLAALLGMNCVQIC